MNILDTSFLFALFFQEDDFHEQAKSIAKATENEPHYVSFLVFQELMTLIMAKVGSAAALKVSEILLDPDSSIQLLNIDEEYFPLTLANFKKLSPHRFSWVDTSLLTLHQELNAKILTFDTRLAKATKG